MGRAATVLGTLVLAVAGGIGGAAAYDEFLLDDATVVEQAPLSAKSQPSNESTGDGALTPAQIYAKTSPGVVLVQALVTEQVDSPFGQQEQQGESTGTVSSSPRTASSSPTRTSSKALRRRRSSSVRTRPSTRRCRAST